MSINRPRRRWKSARLQNDAVRVRILGGLLDVDEKYKDWRSAYESDKRRGHRKKN